MSILSSLGYQIEAHWRKCRPKMVAELERQGKLRQALHAAQELTGRALLDLVQRGVRYPEAWTRVRETWAFLPDEETVPKLGFDPASLEPPTPPESIGA